MYDLKKLRAEFPILEKCVYLDSASTSQTPKRSVEAMVEYFYEYAANHGRGAHHLARKTTEKYEETRELLGKFLDVPAENLVFTRNTTEAINMVARGFCWNRCDEVITTVLDHHSNMLPWMALRSQGVEVKVVPHKEGYIDPDDVADLITKKTRIVAATWMPNILGTIQPIEEIAKIAHDAGAPFISDGAQAIGHIPIKTSFIDYLAIPGHKGLLGPQGTGALYMKDNESLSCSLHGGGMVEKVTLDEVDLLPPPAKYEPGTPNIPGVIGLGRAIELVNELTVPQIHNHEIKLGEKMWDLISEIVGVTVYSPKGSPVVSFNLEGWLPNALARELDDRAKICVRSGMHCAEPLARSLSNTGTVRASVGCYNSIDEVKIFADTLSAVAKQK